MDDHACSIRLHAQIVRQISIHVYIIDVFSRQGLMHIMERLELYIRVLVSNVRHFRDACFNSSNMSFDKPCK